MFRPFKKEQDKKVTVPMPPQAGPIGLQVIKRDGSVQPFNKTKLVTSITNAGATQQQAAHVSNRVVSRLEGNQTIPSSQLSSMVARSLSRVNPEASRQYTSFRNQKTSATAPTTAPTAPEIKVTMPPWPGSCEKTIRQIPATTPKPSTGQMPSTAPKPWTRPLPTKQTTPIPKPTTTARIVRPSISAPSTPIGVEPTTTPTTTPLTVSAAPLTVSVRVNQSTFFQVFCSGGTTPYTYKWFEGATQVGTGVTLYISKSNPGLYTFHCVVTDAAGQTMATNNVEVRVETPLCVDATPLTVTIESGQSATFLANAIGGIPPYKYFWYKGGTIMGVFSRALTISASTGTYTFYCMVEDSAGSRMTTNDVSLIVTRRE